MSETEILPVIDGWITDANGNRASLNYWGSEDAARKSLKSLIDCFGCSDCSDCSGCSRCSSCFRCSDCFGCSDCSRCSRCFGGSDCFGCSSCFDCSDCSSCSRCSRCSSCSRCFDCSRCVNCSDCSGCPRCSSCSSCSRCFDCFRCSDCSRCSRCSRCSSCSGCSRCFDKNGQAPPVPTIENIDAAVYAAASQPEALNMSDWHTCETTHCRAGWVVHLAGDAGKALEEFHTTELAAMLIYRESGSPINPGRFYDGDADALADMKNRAEKIS